MGNKLRDMFKYDKEKYNKELNESISQLIKNHHCSYCIHSTSTPHYEHGCLAGEDSFCYIFDSLKVDYYDGQQCIFWELDKDKEKENRPCLN